MGEARADRSLYRRIAGAFSAYVDHRDPLVRACNVIALIVVGNQPFYPLYVRYLAGPDGWISLLTLLSTPAFALIPALSRIDRNAGLAALPAVGLLNACLATFALGAPAGIELFAIPCVFIALVVMDRSSAHVVAPAMLATLAAYASVYALHGEALATFSQLQYSSLYRLHALSVACLTGFAAISLLMAKREAMKSRSKPHGAEVTGKSG